MEVKLGQICAVSVVVKVFAEVFEGFDCVTSKTHSRRGSVSLRCQIIAKSRHNGPHAIAAGKILVNDKARAGVCGNVDVGFQQGMVRDFTSEMVVEIANT